MVWPAVASAAPKTVCTVTINSSDEKESFQRHLPPGDYQFVELVQRGKPDWLASARQRGVSCDVLVISGHFDDGTEFYTDRHDDREFLTMHEMQHESCSASGNGLFSQLKEVYLFGCNTLKSEPAACGRGRDPAQPAALGPHAGRRRARGRAAERALRPEQPRPLAPRVQGRAGALRLLVEGAAGAHRRAADGALFPDRARGRGRQRPAEPDAAQAVRAELDDRRRRPDRRGPARVLPRATCAASRTTGRRMRRRSPSCTRC